MLTEMESDIRFPSLFIRWWSHLTLPAFIGTCAGPQIMKYPKLMQATLKDRWVKNGQDITQPLDEQLPVQTSDVRFIQWNYRMFVDSFNGLFHVFENGSEML